MKNHCVEKLLAGPVLLQWFGCKSLLLTGVDLLNAAVIQSRSCKRPLARCEASYTLINLAAVFGAGALSQTPVTPRESTPSLRYTETLRGAHNALQINISIN